MGFLSRDAPAALRAGVSVATPLLVVLLIDRPHWSMYAAFGAFTSLYGRTRFGAERFAMQSGAALALVTAVLLGVLTSVLTARTWLAVLIAALIAGAGTVLATVAEWHPPGALFLVFAFGAVASVPHRLADLPAAVAVAAASAVFSLLVANARSLRAVRPRAAPTAEFQPLDVRVKLQRAMPSALSTSVAALVAGTIATGFGIGHPYWATVAAVAPLAARGRSAQLVRAAHRIAGTLGGLLLAALILAPGFGPYPAVAVLAVLQVAAELAVGRNYGVAMLFITPLALLMNQVAAPRPMADLLGDRGLETLIGGAVACLVILAAHQLTKPHPKPAEP
ncbi:FUSC family protein [Actinoplanes sp. OR16]|uniref:FUSC family protein n=1 Tax=Actinoplanes sp. OR16 TaxID=946334 RepID=UPI000F7156E2|nr:FUSC family protein [Actinoplanes sp. OR16]BBH71082.1 FUSC family protein [Actinoplanes sp. OR16]